ncbi:MAG: LysM peptidoglycan-binding domain-containing protein [Treponema sp.]|nr:LysM peptidoglycan-binding domain-containing protein [Treponema sp.]
MKTIGIKLADGSFYPVLDEGRPGQKSLDLTTAHNNQTKIMVDLYRSANCTMDDAEYVDSLQIENLLEHPNGEPDITFQVSIDENNELSAKIIDPETGEQSNTTITLVSRTMEERLHTDDYNISDTIVEDPEENEEAEEDNSTAKAAAIGGLGLLAAASALRDKEENKETEEFSEDDFTLGDPEANSNPDQSDFTLEESDAQNDTEDFASSDDIENPEVVEEEALSTEEMDFAPIPDFEEDKNESEDTLADDDFALPEDTEESPADQTLESDDFNLDDTLSADDFNIPEDTTEESPADQTLESDDFNLDDTLSSDDFNIPEDTTEESPADQTLESDDFNLDDTLSGDDFALPEDTTEESPADETLASDDLTLTDNTQEDPLVDDNILPDFDFNLPNDDFAEESGESDVHTQTEDSFDLPDFGESSENNENQLDEDIFKDMDESSTSPMGNGLSFTGLYDTETELGEPGKHSDEEVQKKTKVPVIICITCAIICIIATLLVLFIIPSKYNLINKKNTKVQEVIEAPVESTIPEEVQEEEIPEEIITPEEEIVEEVPETVPEAKEDEIIVIEEAEEVEPLPPPVKEEKKAESIKYKIKWGDTLWDICDTYYKDPWKYKYLARWNGINNPDHIISGTYIIIPAE